MHGHEKTDSSSRAGSKERERLSFHDLAERVECNMCRFSGLLLFSFFFCKDGSDRLMKRASHSCCNFLCVVLAAAYLKYRRCRLSCLLWSVKACPAILDR